MRTFTQEELNRFLVYHIIDICERYEEATKKHNQSDIDYYFPQIMAYNNMAVVFADSETYLEIQKICKKALKIEEE